MSILLKNPLSKPDDLGKPIPSWPHATSVCLPQWRDNIDYEEANPRVIDKLSCGYPRFVYHPFLKKLAEKCKMKFSSSKEECVVFPSKSSAKDCQDFLEKNSGILSKIHPIGYHEIHCITFPPPGTDQVRCFWQHTGLGVSSRQGLAALENKDIRENGADTVKKTLRLRIAKLTGCSAEHVFLFPTGMSAIFNIYSLLRKLHPQRKSVQFGFPYVDTLKLQEKFGCGVHFFGKGDENDLLKLERLLEKEKVLGIFCEFPMNPLLTSPNLVKLSQIAKKNKTPLIVDDTIGSFENVELIPPADILVSSLTKYFSGTGDVMGGAVTFKPEDDLNSEIFEKFQSVYEDTLWSEDARILEKNSLDYAYRINKINNTTEKLCDFLYGHRAVDRLYYPKFETPNNYNKFKKVTGGYSGVFSVLLKNSERNAGNFFDALEISKGPSLGTNFSLACPYTILAHYNELDKVEKLGISKFLIRFSIGLEEPDDLICRFKNGLNCL